MEAQRASNKDHTHRYGKRSRKTGHLNKQVKAGHGGTLDPAASGVLVVGLGSGTKHLGTFTSCTKTYEAVVLFGASTDTYDADCNVIEKAPYEHITRAGVEEALKKFRGDFKQRPPAFSALRVNGKRSYDIARGDATHVLPERDTHVVELDIAEWMDGGTHDFVWPTPKIKPDPEQDDKHADRERHYSNKKHRSDKTQQPHGAQSIKEQSANATLGSDANGKDPSEDGKIVQGSEPGANGNNAAEPAAETRPEDLGPTMEAVPERSVLTEAVMSGALPIEAQDQSSLDTQHARCPAPAVRLRMTVNSGFYVRSLSHDLGKAVDSSALMSSLVRTRQGDFVLDENTLAFDDLEKGEEVWGPRITQLLDDWVSKHPDP